VKPTAKEIAEFIEEASLVAENPAVIPGIDAEAARQVRRIARITIALTERIAELEQAQADAIKAAVDAANNRAADAFRRYVNHVPPEGDMDSTDFQDLLRSGAPAPGAVK